MPRMRRVLTTALWFNIDGGFIYYGVLGAYALLVTLGVWLISQRGWLPILGALFVLIDGMGLLLLLLHRWLLRRTTDRRLGR